MAGPTVIEEHKSSAAVLLVLFAALTLIASVRVWFGPMSDGARVGASGTLAVICLLLVVGLARLRARPAGRLEIGPDEIVHWSGRGRLTRIAKGPVRLRRGGARASGWYLTPVDGMVEEGAAAGGPTRMRKGTVGLFGYDAPRVADACREHGWRLESVAGSR